MSKRKIIKIDETKCTGCGLCSGNCPEGAIQIIDNKARLVSDIFCDGLGLCAGNCPEGAISIEERESGDYDERKVMENISRQGEKVIIAHLKHLKEHNQPRYLKEALDFLKERSLDVAFDAGTHTADAHLFSCPGSKPMNLKDAKEEKVQQDNTAGLNSQLGNWPVQLKLVPAFAPFLNDSHLLIAADCVAFAYADFHKDLLEGKTLLVGCPKLDDLEVYREKISQILKNNRVKSVTYAHMEVPCCFGLSGVIKDACINSGRDVPYAEVTISISGKRKLP